jgi:hypothetical protein
MAMNRSTMANFPGAVLSAGFLLGFWTSAPSLAAASADEHSLHIAVLVQRHDGNPIKRLAAKDFEVSFQGQSLPTALSRPLLNDKISQGNYLPTRLLIVLGPGLGEPGDIFPGLMPALNPVWRRGWQVAISQYNARATEYATSAGELEQMWNATAGPQVNSKSLVSHMRFFKGRRIVVYVTEIQNRRAVPPDWIFNAASKSMAEMFVVNGGVQAYAPDMLPEPGFGGSGGRNPEGPKAQESGPAPVPGSGTNQMKAGQFVFWPKMDREFYEEVNAQSAIKDAIRDAQGYYDLRISLPPAAPPSKEQELSLKVNLRNAASSAITARAYGNVEVPTVVVSNK